MNVLAFDTCFDACSVAVGRMSASGPEVLAAERQLMKTGHAEALMPMMSDVLDRAGIEYSQIDRIAVTNGPGTFTGTRICVAAARALSLAIDAPVTAFSSLALIAAQAALRQRHLSDPSYAFLVARDARRGELYVQAVDTRGNALTGLELATPEQAASLCPDRPVLVLGSGTDAVLAAAVQVARSPENSIAAATTRDGARIEDCEPDAATMITLLPSTGEPGEMPRPIYMRPADAKPPVGGSIARSQP